MIKNMRETLLIIPTIVAVLFSVSTTMSTTSVFAQGTEEDTQQETETDGQVFGVELSGDNEVPATKSNATGVAQFQLSTGDDGKEVGYSVNLTGFDDITAAHIHSGNEGENGPIVATLSEGAEADGDSVELQLNGGITTGDLEGPLEDLEIADLVDSMNNGSAYVNVHTEIYPDGAIRGQITSTSGSTEAGTNANSTTAGQGASNSNQSADSPNMDIDESLR